MSLGHKEAQSRRRCSYFAVLSSFVDELFVVTFICSQVTGMVKASIMIYELSLTTQSYVYDTAVTFHGRVCKKMWSLISSST